MRAERLCVDCADSLPDDFEHQARLIRCNDCGVRREVTRELEAAHEKRLYELTLREGGPFGPDRC